MKNQLAHLYLSLREVIEPLVARLASFEAVEGMFYRYGWQVSLDETVFGRIKQLLALQPAVEQFLATAAELEQAEELDVQQLGALARSAETLIRALSDWKPSDLSGLPEPLGSEDFWASIGEHVFDDLLEEYLRVYQSSVYLVLHLWGAIRYEPRQPDGPFRTPYTRIVVDWGQALAMVKNPVDALAQTYKWGDGSFEHQRFLQALAKVLRAIHVAQYQVSPALKQLALAPDADVRVPDDADALRALLVDGFSAVENIAYEIGFELYPAARAAEASPSGLLLMPILRGGAEQVLPLGEHWALRLHTAASVGEQLGVAVFPDEIDITSGQPSLDAGLELASTRSEPVYLLGSADTARIELRNPALRLSVQGSAGKPEVRLQLSTNPPDGQPGFRVVVPLDESDSFVKQSVNRDALEFGFSPEVLWSSASGLSFNGNATLNLELPLDIRLGPIALRKASIAAGEGPPRTGSSSIALRVGADLEGKLGPVQFVVERIGFVCNVIPYSASELQALPPGADPPVLGNLGLELDFAPPIGAGLAIDAPSVSGGGFLSYDNASGQYAGVVQLNLEGGVTVKGIGLIATRMPGGASGFSLLVLISAEGFKPISLGMGFTLTAIGGLLALNRTFDEAVLRAGLKNHTLDSVLFPHDPIRNAPQILSNLNKVFPSAGGHHLFGPTLRLAWGASSLITADLGVVLEFGARLRLLILGQLTAILPRPELDLLRLQMDAVGVIDFDQGTAALDATLYDSRLLRRFVLTGDMALRLRWQATPHFALAVGGMHPAFNPPAGFPKLERVALNLTAGDNPRLRCEAYFAITSNTLQFGARAELYASAAGFSLHGAIGFDVLIQLDPFAFLAEFFAQVQLKRGSRNLFMVGVEGSLAGPRPLHVKGKATFKILWWSVSVRFDKTLAGGEAPPAPEPIDVLPRLREALAAPSNWTARLPEGQRQMVSLRERLDTPEGVLLHPLGSLTVKQGVVPLGIEISRFGSTTPAGERHFTISSAQLGEQTQTIRPVNDFFAPAQFFDLSDDQKLSRPSFDSLAAGVSIGADGFGFSADAGDWLLVDAIAFETITVDDETDESHHGDPQNRYTLSAELLLKQASFGAAGSSELRRAGQARYRTERVAHRFAKEGWSIVATDDLSVQALPGQEAAAPTSYTEAVQALRAMGRRELQIMRLSELDGVTG